MFQDRGREGVFSNNPVRVLKFIVIRLTTANSGDPAIIAEGKFPASALGRHQQDHRDDLIKGTPKEIG